MDNNKQKTKFHDIERKIIHIIVGLSLILFVHYNIINNLILLLIVIIGFFTSALHKNYKIPILKFFTERFGREDEEKIPARGLLTLLIGSLISLSIYPLNIALTSIIILSIGDSFSYIIGKYFGKIKIPWNKKENIEGPIIAGVLSVLFVYSFNLIGFIIRSHYLLIFLTAFLVTSIDVKIGKWNVDDNLTIPVVSGGILFLATFL